MKTSSFAKRLILACLLGLLSRALHADLLVEWVADPSHPVLVGGKRVLSGGSSSGRSDIANTAVWGFEENIPLLPEGAVESQPALYGFLVQTHSRGAENFQVAAIEGEGRIKLHSGVAESGETVAMRGALGFSSASLKGSENLAASLRLTVDVVNNAKGIAVLYRAIAKLEEKWYLSELSYPGVTGEIDFDFGRTQWAEWDPLSPPTAALPTEFPLSASALGKPDFVGLFFDGAYTDSGMGIMISRLMLNAVP